MLQIKMQHLYSSPLLRSKSKPWPRERCHRERPATGTGPHRPSRRPTPAQAAVPQQDRAAVPTCRGPGGRPRQPSGHRTGRPAQCSCPSRGLGPPPPRSPRPGPSSPGTLPPPPPGSPRPGDPPIRPPRPPAPGRPPPPARPERRPRRVSPAPAPRCPYAPQPQPQPQSQPALGRTPRAPEDRAPAWAGASRRGPGLPEDGDGPGLSAGEGRRADSGGGCRATASAGGSDSRPPRLSRTHRALPQDASLGQRRRRRK
ncbi:basic proline-rich protein-like [Canis lupus familiaris]|uniref:basic proline-rich protein-like n=1 Tax=Canis lupus familiaris TaxID=9615 RepID=UPI0018F4CF38|nr:basic proline-rich protein-like [Canis lupus familiaris]